MSPHFAQRVAERIGPDYPARMLWDALIWAIENERTDLVSFVSRVSRCGRRLFRFRATDGRFFFVLYHTENKQPITIMPPGFTIGREGKSKMELKV